MSGEGDEIARRIENAEIVHFPRSAALAQARPEPDAPPAPDADPDAEREPEEKAAHGGGDEGETFDWLIETLNGEYALVLMGSRAIVMRETPNAPIEDRTRVLSIEAFNTYMKNKFATRRYKTRDENGDPVWKVSRVNYATHWLASPARRTYDGIEFHPDRDNAPGTTGYFNMWRGFDFEPDASPAPERARKYAIFRDHVLTNICNGNEEYFRWVWSWFAHILQRPRERIGTAIVLRGKMGTGKTKVGEVIGSLFSSHYFLVDDPRYLVGQFNAHMATCLLLQVDEGFWAGDKAAEGRLKGLVTAPKQMIESKGIDPIRLDNYVRLLFSSNEDWVVPAGHEERRFAVFDVAPHVAQNHAYFAEMEQQLNAGGRAALLADLLAIDLDAEDAPNLRVIPKTDALLEQKIRSLDPVGAWWYERLVDGTITHRASTWRRKVPIQTLFNDFLRTAEKIGVRRKADQTAFGMKLRKFIPGLTTVKAFEEVEIVNEEGRHETVRKRVNCYQLPTLKECREHFEDVVVQRVAWDPEDAEEAGEPERDRDPPNF